MISFVYENKSPVFSRVVIDLLSARMCLMEDAIDEES
jgi:hypothetical protein